MVSKGRAAAHKIKHANILLKVDVGGPGWTDERTAEACGCHFRTVANVRQRLVEGGLDAAIERKKREPPPPPVCGGDVFRHDWADGVAVVCGAVFGGLETLDFDDAGSRYDEWHRRATEAVGSDVMATLVVESPSGGRHVFYRRASGSVRGNRNPRQRRQGRGVPGAARLPPR